MSGERIEMTEHHIPAHERKEFDMKDRDPYLINQHLTLQFNDVFAEPDESTYSKDNTWKKSHKCFTSTKLCWYRCLTMCCAIPLSFCWGLGFSCLSFYYIWCWMPWYKCFSIQMTFIRKVYSAIILAFWVPMYAAMGYIFAKVRVTMAQGSPPNYIEAV